MLGGTVKSSSLLLVVCLVARVMPPAIISSVCRWTPVELAMVRMPMPDWTSFSR